MIASQYESVILEAVEKPVKSYNARLKEEIRKIREALVTGEAETIRALTDCDSDNNSNILNRVCRNHNKDFDNYSAKTQKRIRDAIWHYFHPADQQNVSAVEAATDSTDFKAKLKTIIDQRYGGVLFSNQVDGLDL